MTNPYLETTNLQEQAATICKETKDEAMGNTYTFEQIAALLDNKLTPQILQKQEPINTKIPLRSGSLYT